MVGLTRQQMGLIEALKKKIAKLNYVADFQRAETALQLDSELWEQYAKMKELQQKAILYQQTGKERAHIETIKTAQSMEKTLKQHPLVKNYHQKMQDVSDLLWHISDKIESEINEQLVKDKKESTEHGR